MLLTHKRFAIGRCLALSLILCLVWSSNGANSPPNAFPENYFVNEDTTLSVVAPGVLFNDTDPDGDVLQALLVTNVIHGTLTLNTNGSFTYRANTNYNGTDTFSYRARDASSTSAPVIVTLTVNPVNDPPLATNDAYAVNANSVLAVSAPGVLANDYDAEGPLVALLATNVTHGALTLNSNGSFTYTPVTNYAGPDSFAYRVSDGTNTNTIAIVSITVSAVPITVTSAPTNQSVCVGDTVTFGVTATGTAITYQWRKNGTAITGQTNTTLILTNVTAADAATYSVKLSNSVSVLTNSATLLVSTQVTATSLTNQVRYVGATASFSSTPFGGGPFQYEWFKDDVLLSSNDEYRITISSTNSSLVISNLSVTNSGTYSVVVSGGCRSVTNSATLLVAHCFQSLDVMVVIDRSGSMVGQPYVDARTAATNFVRSLILSTNYDLAGINSYNTTSSINQRLTNSLPALEQSINGLPPASNGTCISCGITNAQTELTSIRHRVGALPVMILLSDGVPHDNNDTPSNALYVAAQAKAAGTRIFTVGLGGVDPALMAGIASSPNDFFFATNSAQLSALFDIISTILCRGPAKVIGPTPTNVTVCAGENVNFDVGATGCFEFSYQWRKNGVPLPGQTNAILSFPAATTNDTGFYSVVVTNPCDAATTNGAMLTVNAPTAILAGPTNVAGCEGENASFSVSAVGAGLTYQWCKGTNMLAGKTNSTLTLNNVSASDAGVYSIKVTGLCGNVTNSATLTVDSPPQILVGPMSLTRCAGQSASFSVSASGTSLSYQWRKGFNALTDETNSTLTLNNVSTSDAGIYVVTVSGGCGTPTSTSAQLDVNTPPSLTPLLNTTSCPGSAVSFQTTATGTGPFTYLWRKNGIQVPNAFSATLTINAVVATNAGTYSVEVTGACGTTTNSAVLVVLTNLTATPLVSITNCAGASATFVTSVNGSGPVTIQWRKNGVVIPGATNALLSFNNVTTNDSATYAIEITSPCNSITNNATLLVSPITTASPLIDITACAGDSALFSTVAAGVGPFSFAWRKDGQAITGATNATLIISNVTVSNSGSYAVEVTGACNSATNTASLLVRALTTATPLLDATRCTGESVTFNTTATGSTPLLFAWRKDGVLLPGQTNSSLTIGSVTTNNAGVYSVEVSGACGRVTNSAVLTINTPTAATPLTSAFVCPGTPTSFSTAPVGTGPFSFVWRRDGVMIDGATNATFTIPGATATNAGTYSVEVSGACNTITNSATLTLKEPVTADPLTNATRCTGEAVTFSTVAHGTGPFTFVWRKNSVALPSVTNASLSLTALTTNDSGLYSVEVIGPCNSATQTTTLTVNALTAATPLTSATVCAGDAASFSTVAQGTGPFVFVWRKDGVLLAPETNSVLNVASAMANHAGVYSVEVSGACNTVTNLAVLMVRSLTTASAISSATRCTGDSVTFSTIAAGTGPFTYRWRKNGNVISGETNAALSFSSVSTNDTAAYAVEVTGVCNSVTNTATLTVRELTIASPLANATVCPGEPASFITVPQGSGPFTFRWRKGGMLLASETNSILNIASVTAADSAVYSVEVSGACNTITNSAVLTVRTPVTASAISNATGCAGEDVIFSTIPQGTGPLTFVWRKNNVVLPGATNASLSLTALTTNDTGVYSVEVAGPCNSAIQQATLTVNALTAATSLADAVVCAGGSASFTTVVQGTGPFTFRWRKDGVLLPLETNNVLNITGATANAAGTYSVKISGTCNTLNQSAVLTVRVPITASSISDATRCAGENITFNTTAAGTGPFVYRWRKDGSVIPGETNAALSLGNVSTNDAGVYAVEVTGACNSVTNTATLTVHELTTSSPLSNAVVCAGELVSFATLPQGTGPFTFAWRKDGALIQAQTNATLILSNATPGDSGVYSVEVTGACNSVTNSATLLISQPATATPLADNTTVCAGDFVSFSTIAQGSGPFTFAWRKDGALLTEATNATLTISNANIADNGIYSVEVTGACNSVTNFATLAVRPLTTATPLTINNQTVTNSSLCTGESVTFSTIVTGAPPLTFTWRKDGVLLPLETNSSLSIANVTTNDAGVYSVEVQGACGAVTNTATLSVNFSIVAEPLANVSACEGSPVVFSNSVAGAALFSFVWRKDGVLLPGETNAALVLNAVSNTSAGIYSREIYSACGAVTNSAVLTVSSAPTPFANQTRCAGDTAVFSTTVSGPGPFTFAWRKNGTLLNNQTNNSLTLLNVQAGDGATYRVEVTGPCGPATNSATLTVVAKTTATPMANQSRCAGVNASFSTIAGGTGPFTYVWRKDGVAMPGRTSFSITITNLAPADAGQYSVEVTGACGSVTNSANLIVNSTPVIVGLTNQLVCSGSDVMLVPTISGSGVYTNIWRRNGVVLSGETNATLTVTGVNAGKAGTYSLEVLGSCGSATNSAVLSVRTNLSVTTLANQSVCLGASVTFTAVITGPPPINIVWKKDGIIISNATTSVLTLTNVSAGDAGTYAIEVSGPCNTTNASATLTVQAATAAASLNDLTVCAGESAIFTTTISGGGTLTCQWRKDGSLLPGQTNSTLIITNSTLAQAGIYSIEVNGCNHVTNSAVLTVRSLVSSTLPSRLTACSCSDLVIAPSVSGSGFSLSGVGSPCSYVWKKDGELLTGETNATLNLQRLNSASPGVYAVEISGPCNNVTNSTTVEIITSTSGLWMSTNQIMVPEFGTASPYPSTIAIQCAPRPITKLNVALYGLSHSFPDDLDIMLVSPTGIAIKLMSDCGGSGANRLTGVDLVFDDNAPTYLPDSGLILSGTYKPSDYDTQNADSFQPPAPPNATTALLSSFFGSDPNGVWSLYVVDDQGHDDGHITAWSLDFGHDGFIFTNVSLTMPKMLPDGSLQMQLSGTPNKTYYIEASVDAQSWKIIQTNQLIGTSMPITDATAPQFHYRFYRASGCRD